MKFHEYLHIYVLKVYHHFWNERNPPAIDAMCVKYLSSKETTNFVTSKKKVHAELKPQQSGLPPVQAKNFPRGQNS